MNKRYAIPKTAKLNDCRRGAHQYAIIRSGPSCGGQYFCTILHWIFVHGFLSTSYIVMMFTIFVQIGILYIF